MNAIIIIIDTLRRDHLSPYGSARASEHLAAAVKTPNLEAFAAHGTLFEHAYLGSFPCMPARRELWTGRFEFPWRGWGPLEDDDLDLFGLLRSRGIVTAMVSDHYHLLERDAGNYHFGFMGWEMIRGQEHDPYVTDPEPSEIMLDHLTSGVWRQHLKNLRGARRGEEELYAPRVFRKAVSWLEANATMSIRRQRPFCLLIECFDPHEPWDPPLYTVEPFDPGYEGRRPHSPVYGAVGRFTERELRGMRALYAAELTLVDRWFGYFLDAVERLNLWEDTLIVVTTDHGFFLGEHGLVGKPDLAPLYAEMSQIPFLVYHPDGKPGLHLSQLVQWVDIMPTVVEALDIPLPEAEPEAWTVGQAHRKAWEGISERATQLHGTSLLPLIRGERTETRDVTCSGKFGDIVRVCDGTWALYLPPQGEAPLYWYGRRAPGRTFSGRHGPFEGNRYPMRYPAPPYSLELYHLADDAEERVNMGEDYPEQIERLSRAFINWLEDIAAPAEIAERYRL